MEKPPRERWVSSKAGETEAEQVARVPGNQPGCGCKAESARQAPRSTSDPSFSSPSLPRGQMHRRDVPGCGAGALVHTTLGGVRQAERGGGAPCISRSLSPQAAQPRLGGKPLQPGAWCHSSLYSSRKCKHALHLGLTQRSRACRLTPSASVSCRLGAVTANL